MLFNVINELQLIDNRLEQAGRGRKMVKRGGERIRKLNEGYGGRGVMMEGELLWEIVFIEDKLHV